MQTFLLTLKSELTAKVAAGNFYSELHNSNVCKLARVVEALANLAAK